MPGEKKIKYTKPSRMTNKGPQHFVPPLRWVIRLLRRWVLPIFSLYTPLFWVLWFIYGWQGFIIHDFLFPSFFHVFFKSKLHRFFGMFLYNTNGFRIEIMYDYYIAMKFMFLVVKLSSHYFIGHARLTIFLP
jgi:hypothetical protein